MFIVHYVVHLVYLSLDGSIVLVNERQAISLPNISFRMSCDFLITFFTTFIIMLVS